MNKENSLNIVKRMKLKRQTKLICTLDDKWNNYDNISKLLSLGVDAIEIYSEIKSDVKRDIITKVRAYAKENNQYIPILLNLSYFRVYIDQINKDEDEVNVNQNEILYISNDLNISNEIVIKTEPSLNFKNIQIGDILHANYGEVSFKVEGIEHDSIKCIALNSGNIQKFNSLSVEGKEHFSNDLIIIDKNKLDNEIIDAINQGVEFIIISVIDDPISEIKNIKKIIQHSGVNMNVVVKIDSPKAIQLIDDYIEYVDSIYFSRSDLNLKDSLSKICFYQKSIVNKCGYLGIPVIISGTFLDTMRTLPNPIRAEISDLYNTILQGIDCLLLTAEIISGIYPYEVIETINEICSSCEKRVDYSNLFLEILYKTKKPMLIVEAVASSTVKTSFNLQTPVIVCLTEKGHAARCVAKYRPYCPVLNYTSKTTIALYFGIMRGIFTIVYDDVNNIDSVISHSCEFLVNNKLITTNTNIVLLSGLNEKKNGTTDQMRVINISEFLNIKH